MVWQNWIQVKEASLTFQPFLLLLSTLIFTFSYLIQIWAWYLITLRLGIAISPLETLKGWCYTQFGKYLPGKIWLFIGRFYFYESRGKSRRNISVALYFETATLIVSALLLFFIGLIFFKELKSIYDGEPVWWLVPLALLALLSIHPLVFQKILNWVLLRLKKESISLSLSYSTILWVLLVCILAWVIGGIGFYLFVESFLFLPSSQLLFLTGSLAFSSTLGFIALFAPSGLGVREGVLVYLLSWTMPGPVAVIISVLTRIWMTLIEIGLIGMVYLISRFQKGLEKGDRNV
jgi:uncharacterized membrane protein YbhN (UPF0104 family)